MDLKNIIEPKSMALFGVSSKNLSHPANIIYQKNKGKTNSEIFLVNPSGGTIYGEKIYKSISDIDRKVDVAVLAIRSEHVPAAMKECAAAGVSGAYVISGGFSETGEHGLQEKDQENFFGKQFPHNRP